MLARERPAASGCECGVTPKAEQGVVGKNGPSLQIHRGNKVGGGLDDLKEPVPLGLGELAFSKVNMRAGNTQRAIPTVPFDD